MIARSGLLALVSSLLVSASMANAQVVVQDPNLFASGMQAPRFPPAGDWAEVVTVTSKWLVLQNEKGQQFPVSLDAIDEFVIRWPIDPARITPSAIVEVIGLDLGSNQIRTDHVDVFEGAARAMVRPMYQQIIGFDRRPTAFDIMNQQTYGVTIPLLPGEDQIPNRLHVAGLPIGLDPLRIAIGGNNAVSVFPSAVGLYYSQVTMGTFSYLRPGDLVYVAPSDVSAKTLVLSQMVGYKTIPLSQFVP